MTPPESNLHKRVNLKNQLFLLIAIPVLLGQVIIALVAFYLHQRDLHEQFIQHGHMLTEHYRTESRAFLNQHTRTDKSTFRKLSEQIINENGVRAVRFYTGSDKEHLKVLEHAGPRMRPVLAQKSDLPFHSNGHRFTSRIDSNTLPNPLFLEIELDHNLLQIKSYQSILLLIMVVAGSSLIFLFFANYNAARLSEPIRAISYAIARIREGHLATRVKSQAARGELQDLIDGVNSMAESLQSAHEELQSSVDQATEDLRATLETIEIQNIELDLARKEAEQASRIKSQFLANISHEIRTPLNSIIGFTRLLLKSSLEDKQNDQLLTILKSSENLLSIINDILDVSKIEAGKLQLDIEEVDLRKLLGEVTDILAPLAREKNLKQVLLIDDDVPESIFSDPLRIQQVLTNLINNAIKFSDEGALTIRVSIEASKSSEALIKFSVMDQGIGLSQAAKDKLFEAFHQSDSSNIRRFQGTGLGLTISKHLVELLGGEIGVESTLGEGSIFWFTLPSNRTLPRSESKSAIEQSETASTTRGQMEIPKILAVDDNYANLKLLCALLDDIGVRYDACNSGREAIELSKRNEYDLIFMDIQMPDLDGVEATRKIREHDKRFSRHRAIIALTAHALEEEKLKLIEQGFNHCLTKPVDVDLLISTIEHWTGFSPAFGTGESQTSKIQINEGLAIDVNEGLRLAGNKADLADEMLEMLVTALEDDLNEIEELYEHGNREELLDKVHYVHGACRYCGVPRLKEATVHLETALKRKQEDIEELLEQFRIQANYLRVIYSESDKPVHRTSSSF